SPDDSARGSARGLGDILLRAKYHWLKSDQHNLAVALQLKSATGDEEDFLGTGEATVRPLLIYSRTFGSFTPHLNLGYEFNLDDSIQISLEYVASYDVGIVSLTFAVIMLGRRQPSGYGIRYTLVSAAASLKWNPFGNYIFTGNVLGPLNDDGLR